MNGRIVHIEELKYGGESLYYRDTNIPAVCWTTMKDALFNGKLDQCPEKLVVVSFADKESYPRNVLGIYDRIQEDEEQAVYEEALSHKTIVMLHQ